MLASVPISNRPPKEPLPPAVTLKTQLPFSAKNGWVACGCADYALAATSASLLRCGAHENICAHGRRSVLFCTRRFPRA